MNRTPAKILLVDDDKALSDLLSEFLTRDGFETETIFSGESALTQLENHTYDAIVLDIMMPGLSGLEVLQSIRARLEVPVIMLTGRGDDIDRIIGLEMGADDYLGKPCNPRELSARLRAVLRRSAGTTIESKSTLLESNGIRLDIAKREAYCNDTLLNFTSAEFSTLALLMRSPGEVLTKDTLTEKVLHRKFSAYDRSIDVHISRIRHKLSEHLGEQNIIKSVRGVGYQYVEVE